MRSSCISHASRKHKHAAESQVSATYSAELVRTSSDVMESGTAENAPESLDVQDDTDLRPLYTKKSLYVLHETAGKKPQTCIYYTNDC